MLGFSREEILGRWFGDFIIPSQVTQFQASFARFKAAGSLRNAEWN
jgi:hypothetical protein